MTRPAEGTTRAYLDHASDTPLRPVAFAAMEPYLRQRFGDPGRLHAEGLATRVAIEEAREQVAAFFGARPREVVFTGGATESVNTAVYGAVARVPSDAKAPPHVVVSAVEQLAVRESVVRATDSVTIVGVDRLGRIDPGAVADAIRAETTLVSVQFANQEVGTVQPAGAIVAAAREAAETVGASPLVHLDATSTAGHLPVHFSALGADLVSVAAGPLGGPAAVGALLVRRGLRVPPFIVGGAQERARRAGLENVPGIVGFGAAAAELTDEARFTAETAAARRRTDEIVAAGGSVRDVLRYGDPTDRLPNLVCVGVAGVEAEPILLGLDQRGVAVHSGSACSSEVLEPSPVLAAMGADAEHSLRISVGWCSTDADVEAFASAFPLVVNRLRDLRAG